MPQLKVDRMKLQPLRQPLTSLERKLRAELRRLSVEDSALLVAVSGGADSVALLDALVRWRARRKFGALLCVAHLNHQLRGAESEADEKFVQELAARWNLPAVIERLEVQAEATANRQNLEATARRLRYKFLQRAARACETPFVLTAHTQDDQAETVLMRLLRGSGAAGLRGIHPQLVLESGCQLLRPLLTVSRAEVLAHCAQYSVAYRTDSSNLSLDFTRNRIRHEVLPLLRSFNPRTPEVLARTAELLAVEEAYLDTAAQQASARCLASPRRLSVPALLAQPQALQARILRAWGQAAGISLDAVHVAALERLAHRSQSGRGNELPGGWRVTREFTELRLHHVSEAGGGEVGEIESRAAAPLLWRTAQPVRFGRYDFLLRRNLLQVEAEQLMARESAIGWTALLRESPVLDELELRTRRAGDAYVPAGRRSPVKLKTLLIRHKIAKAVRADYPVLMAKTDGVDAVLWAPGLPVAAAFVPPPDVRNCALITAREA
jgi:tRNA(Ile)-lysidine synthase